MDSSLLNSTDEELANLILQSSHDAFAILVERHTRKFYAIAYRTLFNKNEAQDIVQECFLKYWESPSLFKSNQSLWTTWFYKVVINNCYDLNKKKSEFVLDEEIEIEDENTVSALKIVEEKQTENIVNQVLKLLPVNQIMAINLCYYQGLTNIQAAEIMGLNIKALESLLKRAKDKLKQQLQNINL